MYDEAGAVPGWQEQVAVTGPFQIDFTSASANILLDGYHVVLEETDYPQTMNAVTVDVVACGASSNTPPPTTQQIVKNELVGYGDGETTSFETRFPYRRRGIRGNSGALRVTVNGHNRRSRVGNYWIEECPPATPTRMPACSSS